MNKINKENCSFEDSLKSIETENFIDRLFYRPIAYRMAILLSTTPITPNAITIISIVIGVFAGTLFYPQNIWINIIGFLLFMVANILDCIDGQLARLTNIKSAVGRILDGLAGDFWFISLYISIALRISPDLGVHWAWGLAALAGFSNLIQANITDYYKTAHLFFISEEKGSEFDTIDKVKKKYASMPKGINRFLYQLYIYYTALQTLITPQLQAMLGRLKDKYGEKIPSDVRLRLRNDSKKIIPLTNINTFNGRSVVLLLSIIIQHLWVYLLFEVVVLNIILIIAVRKHENNCKRFEV